MRKKKVYIILGIVVSGISVFAMGINKSNSKAEVKVESSKTAVETVTIENSKISKYKKFSGVIIAGEIEIVTPKTLSNIVDINIKEGDYVKKGDTLMILDSSKIDEQINELSEVSNKVNQSIEETRKKANELIQSKDKKLEEKKILEDEIVVLENENSQIDLDIKALEDKFNQGEIDEAQMNIQKVSLNKKKGENKALIMTKVTKVKGIDLELTVIDKSASELDKIVNSSQNSELDSMINVLKDQKGNYIVSSGISGQVKEVNLKEGQMPVSFTKAGILIENSNVLDLEIYIDKSNLENFKKGMDIEVVVESEVGEKNIKAKIESVSKEANERTGQYSVIATFGSDDNIKVGDFAKIFLPIEKKDDIITLTKDAIIREEESNFVFVCDEKNVVSKKEVTLGTENHKDVEIISGIEIGEEVIIKGKEFIKEGDSVNVVKEITENEDN